MIDPIERILELEAPPERVWRALSDPEELALWFGHSAELDLRPGGGGWFGWSGHGRFAVRVEEVDAPRRLAWRWARDSDVELDESPSTLVEWELEEGSDGGTVLHLRESGFELGQDREQNVRGWRAELGDLADHLSSSV